MSLPPSFLSKLRDILPRAQIFTTPESLQPYECDGLTFLKEMPAVAVLPKNRQQLQALLALCYRLGVPIVTRGAGTGLSGGARPSANALLLLMSHFNKILHIDPQNRCARVECGVRNLAVSEAAAAHGLFYAPDPSSQIACSIGGNIAENSGGIHCIKYGMTLQNLLAVKLLTIEGHCLEIGVAEGECQGYDLLSLITGSEGLLGVILEATLRLLPCPPCRQVLLAGFPTVADAGHAVGAIIAAGHLPAGLEMMDKLAIEAAENHVHAGYPSDAAALLLCEVDGSLAAVEAQLVTLRSLLSKHHASSIRCSQNDAERELLWSGRKAAIAAIGRISPDFYTNDGTIPRRHLARVLKRIDRLGQKYGLRVANVFHAGDGNLHPLILYDSSQATQRHNAEQLGNEILSLCIKMGGTITGEHGVGAEKLDAMCEQFNPLELRRFHAVKALFDPLSLCNPGKAVPSLHRCAELGGMHVHQGRLPHPDLPRF